MVKNLRCSSGTKQCGGRCIPRKQHCHADEPDQSAEERRKKKKAIVGGLLTAGALATAAVILSRKKGSSEGKYETGINRPVDNGFSRKDDLAEHRADLPASAQSPNPVIIRAADPVPVGSDIESGRVRRHLQLEAPREPNFSGEFDTASGAIENHVKQQIEYNRYIARIKAAEALEVGNGAYFIDLEMTGVSSGADHGYTPLNNGEPVSIGIVSGGSGNKELSIRIPVKPSRKISPVDTRIHGIRDEDVSESRTFEEIYPQLKDEFTNRHIYTYGPTDLIWIDDACRRSNLPLINYANVVRNSDGTIDWSHDGTTADVRRIFGDYLGPKVDANFIGYVGREMAKPLNRDLPYEEKVRKYSKPQGEVGYYIQLPAYDIPGLDAGSHDPVVDSYRTKRLMIDIARGVAKRP